jgi:hypothetical protein
LARISSTCKTEIKIQDSSHLSLDVEHRIARHEDHLEGYSACSDVSGIPGYCAESDTATTADPDPLRISDKQNQKYEAKFPVAAFRTLISHRLLH